jgi:hypothetical protein
MNNKKNVYMTGTLASPLKKRVRALIKCSGTLVYTSPVVEIRTVTTDCACFETMNSVYHVSLAPVPFRAPLPDSLAMCA